ncbi:TIGR03619 family F420-dependent LLM class oxidoreductase [Streptomyces sp. NPDC097610]|uniref:TIGR03619 family F420-dependent LLM class oxidoreductase n=1 Tax=Streptomyces sp. NPDC097610 TaxID=3157227 RepID=UPI0033217A39
MGYWLQTINTAPEELLELCVLAEELGFEGVTEGDHWFMPADSDEADPDERAAMPWDYSFNDPFVTAGAVLTNTSTLKFGPGVLVLANRTNAFTVAKAAATAARIGGDRFVLGVGAGWMKEEYDIAGVDWSTRVPRTVEMIDVLRKLWTGGPVEHHGRFFDFRPTHAYPAPNRPIPIYLGGLAPAALRRAGRVADGLMGAASRLEEIEQQIACVEEGRREADREKEPFHYMSGLSHGADGGPPTADDHRRLIDLGVTQIKFGPVEHRLGKPYCTFEEKKREVERFAESVMSLVPLPKVG